MSDKIKTYILIRNIFLMLILIGSSYIFYGCSGCSQSGIRDNQQKRNYSNTDSPTRNKRSVDASKEKEPKERNSIPDNTNAIPLNTLYKKYKPSVFMIYTSDGVDVDGYQGTGFFISKTGIAVSNYHVFKGTSQGLEVIETSDGHKLNIEKVLSKSDENDFIIFKVRLSGYNINNPIPISFQEPQIGEDVFAIGNPRGLESTLSKGIISGFREKRNYIQTTTEITHGSSGGPLLNMRGEVVGITTAGLGEANLNFAINIKQLPLHKYNLGN
ncbi:serine protease [Candidatus Gracilibacteria bacterium]|nr:serine protease [Candidatus Gracilibacteria bacterium]